MSKSCKAEVLCCNTSPYRTGSTWRRVWRQMVRPCCTNIRQATFFLLLGPSLLFSLPILYWLQTLLRLVETLYSTFEEEERLDLFKWPVLRLGLSPSFNLFLLLYMCAVVVKMVCGLKKRIKMGGGCLKNPSLSACLSAFFFSPLYKVFFRIHRCLTFSLENSPSLYLPLALSNRYEQPVPRLTDNIICIQHFSRNPL